MPAKEVRLHCGFSLGDIVALSGAVRELKQQYPHDFVIEPQTTCAEVWWYNPLIARTSSAAQTIDCGAVHIDRTGESGMHYVEAYLDLLNRKLGTKAELRHPRGDIYLSEDEKSWYSAVQPLTRGEIPYWIICSGGKFDIPIKWWSHDRYQSVVDHFEGRLQFVQVGTHGNHHPRLNGTIDFRGKTNIRDLIHLMYYAGGVICGVTSLMHLAAAVPTERGIPRDAVIVAGAREPRAWEAYPHHHFLASHSTVTCRNCWKQRFFPLPDRRGNSSSALMCAEVSNNLPKCMDAISEKEAIDAIESILQKGEGALSRSEAIGAREAVDISVRQNDFDVHNITPLNAVTRADEFIAQIPSYPAKRFSGRGIVICGGGVQYFANAWVCINILRQDGCKLPVELWYLGRQELDRNMEALVADLGVTCVNARSVMNRHPFRNPLGWELKSYALLNSRFEEVLSLDADNVALRNPEYMFDSQQYQRTGAVFWPDYGRLGRRRAIWKVAGIEYRDEPEFESGQMVIDKRRCWKPVNLAFWYNDHSEFFYKYVHGDKETFHMAWRKLNVPYAIVPFPIKPLRGTMCQADFHGRILFQHRNLAKWNFFGENERIPDFELENECLEALDELRRKWDGKINKRRETVVRHGFSFRKHTSDENVFREVYQKNEYRLPETFEPSDRILDIGCHIGSFAAACHARGSRSITAFEPDLDNAALAKQNLKNLPGVKVIAKAVLHRRLRVELNPYPRVKVGENTGGGDVVISPDGVLVSVEIDGLLRRLGSVRLMKLDCEGSEWPILFYSRELWRVQEICGEFHFSVNETLSAGLKLNHHTFRRLLRQRFSRVKTVLDRKDKNLGKFWASKPSRNLRPHAHVRKFGRTRNAPARAPSLGAAPYHS